MADRVSLHSLPVFLRLAGRPVMLIGDGEAADAKRRLLERAGAAIVGEEAQATLAIVAMEEPDATVARLKARGVLVNAVDRPDLCDFTLPAIVDRSPVIVAIGTGGVSAGLAAALRQRLEGLLPSRLGNLATALFNRRDRLRSQFPDPGDRRRAIADAMLSNGPLDPLTPTVLGQARYEDDVDRWLKQPARPRELVGNIVAHSPDPDDLSVKSARWLSLADRVYYDDDVPEAILSRARADAVRIKASYPANTERLPGVSVHLHYLPPMPLSDEDAELFGIDLNEENE